MRLKFANCDVSSSKYTNVNLPLPGFLNRPFVILGFRAIVKLIPLTATSTDKRVRCLDPSWTKLYRLIYAIAVLGMMHYPRMVKLNVRARVVCCLILRRCRLIVPGISGLLSCH
jgi:DMSO/TMAO reductase YedYZ heme-binding membrane subunit